MQLPILWWHCRRKGIEITSHERCWIFPIQLFTLLFLIQQKELCDQSLCSVSYWARSECSDYEKEDSHNCCPYFDPEKGTALFAVYDGHGGAEVAQYMAMHLPESNNCQRSIQGAFIIMLKFKHFATDEERAIARRHTSCDNSRYTEFATCSSSTTCQPLTQGVIVEKVKC